MLVDLHAHYPMHCGQRGGASRSRLHHSRAPILARRFDRRAGTPLPQRRAVLPPVPQSPGEGLSDLGVAAVRAMVKQRILVDVSHMHTDALSETFALLDQADPDRSLPVISSHAGFRFGEQDYMHDRDTLRAIADRDGVTGLIMAQHQLLDGVRDDPPSTNGSSPFP